MMHKIFSMLLSVLLLVASAGMASAADLDLDDTFFQAGKYYVVAVILLIIFAVLFTFLMRLEMRVRKLEKRSKS